MIASSIFASRLAFFTFVVLSAAGISSAADARRKTEDAAEHGLVWLSRQQHEDGSFEADRKKITGATPAPKVAGTAMAVLAFLSEGHAPDTGRFGLVVRNAVDFLIAQVPDDGYVGKTDGGRMFSQGIVTLALVEASGVESSVDKRRAESSAITKLIGAILKSQGVGKKTEYVGGWGYEPDATDGDMRVTGWNALALRAAEDGGFPIPTGALARAAAFIARCYVSEPKGFAYQPGGECRVGTTATGVLCLYLLDDEADHRAKASAAATGLVDSGFPEKTDDPFYSAFYLTHAAAAQLGSPNANTVFRQTSDWLLKNQSPDGAWSNAPGGAEPGGIYPTAMAILTLSVPQRLLPVYQR